MTHMGLAMSLMMRVRPLRREKQDVTKSEVILPRPIQASHFNEEWNYRKHSYGRQKTFGQTCVLMDNTIAVKELEGSY